MPQLMQRRHLLLTAGSLVGRASRRSMRLLRLVPATDLLVLDPILTVAAAAA